MGQFYFSRNDQCLQRYKASVLREYVPIIVPLLVGNVLFPRLLPWEVNAAHELIDLSKRKMGPDAIVTEMLIQTASAECSQASFSTACAIVLY